MLYSNSQNTVTHIVRNSVAGQSFSPPISQLSVLGFAQFIVAVRTAHHNVARAAYTFYTAWMSSWENQDHSGRGDYESMR